MPHTHTPTHPHTHTPTHAHTPAHAHAPGPQPAPSWPVFASAAALKADPWAAYYTAVYGGLPDTFPLDVSSNWMLHDGALVKAKVTSAPQASTCPAKVKDRYTTNDMYQPPLVSWIWHMYPYAALPANSWHEVIHEADPFGDEHFGMWLMYAPGSGIYFNLGNTISFAEHADAYAHFNIAGGQARSRHTEHECSCSAERNGAG